MLIRLKRPLGMCQAIELLQSKYKPYSRRLARFATIILAYQLLDQAQMTLQITIATAVLERNTELVGQMTPYCRVEVEGKAIYTTSISNGNRPDWNEKFQCGMGEKTLNFVVMDKERFKSRDDIIGKGVFDFRRVTSKPNMMVTEQVVLSHDGVNAGRLMLNIMYQEGLKFIGMHQPMDLDLSRAKVGVGIAGSRTREAIHHQSGVPNKQQEPSANVVNKPIDTITVRQGSLSQIGRQTSPLRNDDQEHKGEPLNIIKDKANPNQSRRLSRSVNSGGRMVDFKKTPLLKKNLFSMFDNFSQQFQFVPPVLRTNSPRN